MSVSIRIYLRTEERQLSFSFSLSLAVAGTFVEGMAHNRGGMMPSSALLLIMMMTTTTNIMMMVMKMTTRKTMMMMMMMMTLSSRLLLLQRHLMPEAGGICHGHGPVTEAGLKLVANPTNPLPCSLFDDTANLLCVSELHVNRQRII